MPCLYVVVVRVSTSTYFTFVSLILLLIDVKSGVRNMGMSSETVRIVSSGSCLVRELWCVAAACGQTNAYWALTVHPIKKRIRHFLSRTRWNVLAERC